MLTTVDQISVFVENAPGRFAMLTKFLKENNINMRAFSVAESQDFGIVRIIVDDPKKTSAVLKNAGYIVSATPVLALEIPDEPGGLLNVLDIIGAENINLTYMYAFISKKQDSAYVIIRVEDNETVAGILAARGINLISQKELLDL